MTPSRPCYLNRNFADILGQAANRWPDREAIWCAGHRTSFARLLELSASVAAHVGRQIDQGDRVGVFLERGPEAAAAFFGVLAAGGVAININEKLRPRQVEHILADSGARLLLTTSDLLRQQPRELETAALISTLDRMPAAAWQPKVREECDLAHIIYTSGSTGLPKGVMVSHGNLWAGARVVSGYLGLTSEDRIVSLLPFSFDYGLNQLLCAVQTSAALVVEGAPLAQQIARGLREQNVTVLPAVPPTWLQLLTIPEFQKPIPSLRIMTNTGGRIPTDAVRALRAAQPQARLFLMYGLTEAFRASFLPPEEVDNRPDSIGKAIPESEIHIVGEDGQVRGPGETGELVQAGSTVTLGYWKNPDVTSRIFRPHPLRPDSGEKAVYSGDLVRTDSEGFLYFIGRRDRMIKSMGFRLSPDEVLEVLYRSKQVMEAAIATEPDDVRGSKIVAHVALNPNGSIEALKKYCRAELPAYAQPARFEVHASLPRTTSGKHDVSSLGRSDG